MTSWSAIENSVWNDGRFCEDSTILARIYRIFPGSVRHVVMTIRKGLAAVKIRNYNKKAFENNVSCNLRPNEYIFLKPEFFKTFLF